MKKITTVTREYDGNGRVIKEVQVEETVLDAPSYPYVNPTVRPFTPAPIPTWTCVNTAGDCQ
jgi:hypothetical protein